MRWAALLALAGCGVEGGRWDDVPIQRAWLERFDLSTLNAVVGVAEGDAVLVFEEPAGGAGSVPVHLGGGNVGVAFDLSLDFEGHDGVVDIDLDDVESPTVGDVFGTYHGTAASASAVIGGGGRRMRNGHGASFREDHFELGLGVFAGYEWIVLREGGGDALDGDPPTDGDAPTGDTGDTDPPTTPPTTTPTTTVPATSTGTTTGTSDGGGGAGCECGGGGGGGCDCEGASGCACAHGGLAPAGLVWVGALLRRRRREPTADG